MFTGACGLANGCGVVVQVTVSACKDDSILIRHMDDTFTVYELGSKMI